MWVRHKGVEDGIMSDAPFVGARISSIGCSNHCEGCFNQHLLDVPVQESVSWDLIMDIRQRKLNEGIILGGLEWTEQPEEMMELVELALLAGMQVMIYTHHSFFTFTMLFPTLVGKPIYVKCGEYMRELDGYFDAANDVRLASTNQTIVRLDQLEKR